MLCSWEQLHQLSPLSIFLGHTLLQGENPTVPSHSSSSPLLASWGKFDAFLILATKSAQTKGPTNIQLHPSVLQPLAQPSGVGERPCHTWHIYVPLKGLIEGLALPAPKMHYWAPDLLPGDKTPQPVLEASLAHPPRLPSDSVQAVLLSFLKQNP